MKSIPVLISASSCASRVLAGSLHADLGEAERGRVGVTGCREMKVRKCGNFYPYFKLCQMYWISLLNSLLEILFIWPFEQILSLVLQQNLTNTLNAYTGLKFVCGDILFTFSGFKRSNVHHQQLTAFLTLTKFIRSISQNVVTLFFGRLVNVLICFTTNTIGKLRLLWL